MRRLGELGYATDKGDAFHRFAGESFLDVYERYFAPWRHRPVTLLEIGVHQGESLRMWREFFPFGRIFGLDIDPACKVHEGDRIHVEIGSQDDPEALERLVRRTGPLSAVIDDGSHVNTLTLASLRWLFPHVAPGGLYAIEDLHCSYEDLRPVVAAWPGMQHNRPLDYRNDRRRLDAALLEIIGELDHGRGQVRSVQYWSKMCVLVKV
jgi:cephalosporin hydroxylase